MNGRPDERSDLWGLGGIVLLLAALVIWAQSQGYAPVPRLPDRTESPQVDPAPKEPDPGPQPSWPKGQGAGRPRRSPVSPTPGRDGVSPDGKTEVAIDLPVDHWLSNKVGSDRLGLCVFTSINMAADWQHVKPLMDLRDWMTKRPGGGWPEKVDKVLKEKAPNVQYVQYIGTDPSIIEAALKGGRMPCLTWGGGHMLNCLYLDSKWACLLDNNLTKPPQYLWYTRQQFMRGWTADGGGWVVVLCDPGPPPPPYSGPTFCEAKDSGPEIDRTKFPQRESYWCGRGPMSLSQAMNAVQGITLPNDLACGRVVIVGSNGMAEAAANELRASPDWTALSGDWILQTFTPDEWQISRAGFVTVANPTVYIEGCDGSVQYRFDEWPGAECVLARLRRPRPDYDPSKDRGLPAVRRKLESWMILAGIGVGIVLLRDRK